MLLNDIYGKLDHCPNCEALGAIALAVTNYIFSTLMFLGVGVPGSGQLYVSVSLVPFSTCFPLVLGDVSNNNRAISFRFSSEVPCAARSLGWVTISPLTDKYGCRSLLLPLCLGTQYYRVVKLLESN